MQRDPKDAGTLEALMIRLREYRLPRALRILDKVNQGQVLLDSDLEFLHRVLEDSRGLRPLIERNPDYMSLVCKLADLYSEIVSKSLENEKRQNGV